MSPRILVPWLLALSLGATAQNPANDSSSQTVVGQISTTDAHVKGSVQFASGGACLMSGAFAQAGETTAEVRLERSGEVRVCPRTSISITSSQNGRDLMFGLNTGAMEAHYRLSSSADAIITPDFRILLAGPGTFHYGIGVDNKGNSCVQSLVQNTASVIVSELMGDGMYQVKANEQVMFRGGSVANPDHQPGICGCPAATPPVMRAAPAPAAAPAAPDAAPAESTTTAGSVASADGKPRIPLSLSRPLPSGDMHVQVDAPFVYNASDPDPTIVDGVAQLRVSAGPMLPIVALPPPAPPAPLAPVQTAKAAPKPPEKKKFFGKVRAFFA